MSELTEINITAKQRKFAELLVRYDGEKSATECAISAGYPKKTARIMPVVCSLRRSFLKLRITYRYYEKKCTKSICQILQDI